MKSIGDSQLELKVKQANCLRQKKKMFLTKSRYIGFSFAPDALRGGCQLILDQLHIDQTKEKPLQSRIWFYNQTFFTQTKVEEACSRWWSNHFVSSHRFFDFGRAELHCGNKKFVLRPQGMIMDSIFFSADVYHHLYCGNDSETCCTGSIVLHSRQMEHIWWYHRHHQLSGHRTWASGLQRILWNQCLPNISLGKTSFF